MKQLEWLLVGSLILNGVPALALFFKRVLNNILSQLFKDWLGRAFPETDEGIPPFTPFVQELSSVR